MSLSLGSHPSVDKSSGGHGSCAVAPDTLRRKWYTRMAGGLWLTVVLLICLRVVISPHRQSVYAADYLPAGLHWLHGQEIYSFRHNFIYSPLVAAAFAPLAVLPEGLSGVLWRLLCIAALICATRSWLRSGMSGIGDVPAPESGSPVTVTVFLLLLPLAVGNVNLGQMNIVVLAATAGSILAVQRRHWNTAALLLAAMGFMKIYPFAIGLLLALLYPRQLSWRLGLAVILLFFVSLGLQHPGYALGEYRQWFGVLGRDDRMDVDLYASWRDFGYLVRACGIPLSNLVYRLMEAAAGGLLACFLFLGQRRWAWSETRLLGGVFSLGCVWMLLFGPATEHATYIVLSLPVCAALAAAWARAPRLGRARGAGLFGALALSYVLLLLSDILNAWFHGITHHLCVRALQPVAALLFAAGTVWWLVRRPTNDPSPTK